MSTVPRLDDWIAAVALAVLAGLLYLVAYLIGG